MAIVWQCGRCKSKFVGSAMTAWCDCGNTRFRTKFEIDRGITIGSAIVPVDGMSANLGTVLYVWCEKPTD